jgi:peroxisomal membrane protein 4
MSSPIFTEAFTAEFRFAILSIWRGIRQGTFQGTKIRLPHSTVNTFVNETPEFTSQGLKAAFDKIAGMTWEHSKNLAVFVGLYKMALAMARLARLGFGDKLPGTRMGFPSVEFDSFLAGGMVGHFVWGRSGKFGINQQIVFYLTPRVLSGLAKVLSEKGYPVFKNWSFEQVYPYWASLTWAFVMWLFETYPQHLQSGLKNTMKSLYHDSNTWTNAEGGSTLFFPSPATAAVFVYLTLRARELALGGGNQQQQQSSR